MCTDKKLLFGFIIHFPSGDEGKMQRSEYIGGYDENGKW
jgi:hypothetical protein